MDVLEERVPLADPVRFRPQIQVTPTTFSALGIDKNFHRVVLKLDRE